MAFMGIKRANPSTEKAFLFFATLVALLITNQIFVESKIITLFLSVVMIMPFYSILRQFGKRAEQKEDIMSQKDSDELKKVLEILEKTRTSVDELWTKASNISLGTDAQSFSLDETTNSIECISESIQKTVYMVDRLSPSANSASQSVLGLVESINEISNHNKEVLKVLDQAIADIREMSSSVNIINENFRNLERASESSSKGITDISVFAKEIERSAKESYTMSEEVVDETEHGGVSVKKTIESMENIRSIVSESSHVIKTLGEKSGEIGNIIKFIDSVTKRINLLALNASIISSQAGEHGKAFAVVAAEMENLANQTSTSTVEISLMINAIEDMVQNTVQANEVGMWGVEEGVTLANTAGEILKKIQDRSKASREMSKRIMAATGEQAAMAEGVLESIREESKYLEIAGKSIENHVSISKSVDESANSIIGLSREVRSAIDRQHHSSKDISNVINEVIKMVEELMVLTRQQGEDSDQVKQATEIITFISSENINAIKDMAKFVENLKTMIDAMSKEIL